MRVKSPNISLRFLASDKRLCPRIQLQLLRSKEFTAFWSRLPSTHSFFHVETKIPNHRIMQQPPPPCLPLKVRRAALVAASKTSSTPSPVKLEHSRYFRAPHACAIS